jgi:hypothetical protein
MKMEKSKNNPKQPMKYWLVEFTLTSGETTSFYVKAISQFEAYKKADEYTYWLGNKTLESKLKTFRLMP